MPRCTISSSALITLLCTGCFGTPEAEQLFAPGGSPAATGPGGTMPPSVEVGGGSSSPDVSPAGEEEIEVAAGGHAPAPGAAGEAGSAGNAVAGQGGSAGSTADSDAGCPEVYRTCAHTFRFDDVLGVAQHVELWGVFPPNVWSSGIELQRTGASWFATVDVPWAFDVRYKYLVDDAWLVDPAPEAVAVEDLQGGGMSSVLEGGTCAAFDCGGVAVPDCPESQRAAHLRMVFEDAGYDAVGVAGSFNDWQPASMSRIGTHWAVNLSDLPWGSHVEYKFVVDGYWVQDPTNAVTNPDGFGGLNSVLRVEGDWWSCAAGTAT